MEDKKTVSMRLNIIIVVIFIIAVGMLLLYFVSTYNPNLSNDSKVWAEFGGFLSPILTLITLVILIYTIQQNRIQEERNLIKKKKEELGSSLISLYREILFYFQEYKEYEKIKSNIKKIKKKINSINDEKNKLKKQLDLGVDDTDLEIEEEYEYLLKKNDKCILTFNELENKKELMKRNIETIFRNLSKIISDIEILIFLYFSNEEGSKIVAYLEYSRNLLNNKKEAYKLVGNRIENLITFLKRKSLDSVYIIDNKSNSNLSNEQMGSMANNVITEIDEQFGIDVLRNIRKSEDGTKT